MFEQTFSFVTGKLSREQLHALRGEGFCATLAIAGSGKTRLLASQVIFRLAEGGSADLSDMAIITFSNKAGAELRHRIHQLLEFELGYATANPNKDWEIKCRTALGALPEAQVGTIDAIVASWVRRLAAVGEIEVDPKFRVPTTASRLELVESAWNRLSTALIGGTPDPNEIAAVQSIKLVGSMKAKAVLDEVFGIFGPAEKAIGALEEFMELEGETAKLLYKGLAWPEYERLGEVFNDDLPGRIRQALDELGSVRKGGNSKQEVIESLTSYLELSEETSPEDRLQQLARVLFIKGGGIKTKGLKEMGTGTPYSAALTSLQEDLASRFEFIIKMNGVNLDATPAESSEIHKPAIQAILCILRWIGDSVAKAMERDGLLSFDGVCRLLLAFLERPGARDILSRYRMEPRQVLVDEAQDLNMDQFRLICAMVGADPLDPVTWDSLFFVGDPEQSIYRFRGANPVLMGWILSCRAKLGTPGRATWYDQHLKANSGVGKSSYQSTEAERRGICLLTQNYRSAAALLEWIDKASGIAASSCQIPYRHSPLGFHGAMPAECREVSLLAPSPTAASSASQGMVEMFRRLAAEVAATKSQKPGRKWGDFLMLSPSLSGHVRDLRMAFGELGIPVRMSGNWPIMSTRAARDIMVLLSCLSDHENTMALLGVLRGPIGRLTDEEILLVAVSEKESSDNPTNLYKGLRHLEKHGQPASPEATAAWNEMHPETRRWILQLANWFSFGQNSWRRRVDRMPVQEMLRQILDATGAWDAFRIDDPLNGVDDAEAVLEVVGFHASNGMACAAMAEEFLRMADTNGTMNFEADSNSEADAVRCMTVHNSKGLEAEVVCLLALEVEKPPKAVAYLRSDLYRPDAPLGVELLRKLDFLPLPLSTKDVGNDSLRNVLGFFDPLSEEQERSRLFHVAVTRAKEKLILLLGEPVGAGSRHFHGIISKVVGSHPVTIMPEVSSDSASIARRMEPLAPAEPAPDRTKVDSALLVGRQARIGLSTLLPLWADLVGTDAGKAAMAGKILKMLGDGIVPRIGAMTPGISDPGDESVVGKFVGTVVHRFMELEHALNGLSEEKKKQFASGLVRNLLDRELDDVDSLENTEKLVALVVNRALGIIERHSKPGSPLADIIRLPGISEVDFTLRAGRWVIAGRMDRILADGSAIDWKTDTGEPAEIVKRYYSQMMFYALALLERRRSLSLDGDQPIVIHLALTSGKGLVVDLAYTVAELEIFKARMKEILYILV